MLPDRFHQFIFRDPGLLQMRRQYFPLEYKHDGFTLDRLSELRKAELQLFEDIIDHKQRSRSYQPAEEC